MKEAVKIVIFVPETHAGIVREALGKSGAGDDKELAGLFP